MQDDESMTIATLNIFEEKDKGDLNICEATLGKNATTIRSFLFLNRILSKIEELLLFLVLKIFKMAIIADSPCYIFRS